MARTGKPPKTIDQAPLEKPCSIQCTAKEISSVLACYDKRVPISIENLKKAVDTGKRV